MIKAPSYLKIACLIYFTCLSLLCSAEVTVNGELVSANFKDVALQDALRDVAKATKTRIVLNQPIEDKISMGFNDVSLTHMLNELLAQYNYMLLMHSETKPKEVIVMSKKASAGELAEFIPPPPATINPNVNQPNQNQQQDGKISEVTLTIGKMNARALVDESSPSNIISLDVIAQAKIRTPDGREARDGDYVEIPQLIVNGVAIGTVPMIAVHGLPVGAIISKDLIDQAGLSKKKASNPNIPSSNNINATNTNSKAKPKTN